MSYMKRCWAQVDLDALELNYQQIRAYLQPQTRLLAIVKADAYGHGDQQVGLLMERLGADYLGVACYDEALSLRVAGCQGPILILGPTPAELAPGLAQHRITQTVYSPAYAQELEAQARKAGVVVEIHAKLDTGMNRIGFEPAIPAEMEQVAGLYRNTAFHCTGIFTHFCCADENTPESLAFTKGQYELFHQACEALARQGIDCGIRHCSGTAATMLYPDWHMDMIRWGIGLYGMLPSGYCQGILPMAPVMSLHSVVSMVKELPQGAFVGYGRQFQADRPMRVATVPIGYADGYSRSFCNKARMLIRGQYARVLGKICMDQTMVDVTDIPGVQAGDPVVVAGRDGDNWVTFDELAVLSDTINYDRTCALAARVPRVYFQGGQVVEVRDYLTCRK